MEIIALSKSFPLLQEGIQYFWKKWGSESNFRFYEDCILHSLSEETSLPKFYVVLDNNTIIGSYALLTNDIISRQDLMPWFACLYVNDNFRNKGIAGEILKHGLVQARDKGFKNLYLSTDLVNFYERKGWQLFGKGYGVGGDEFNIYVKSTG